MIDDVYNSKLLHFAGNITCIGNLDAPDATAKAVSKLCGSSVAIDLKMEDGKVSQFAQQVKACALGQATASIVAENIIGATELELREAHREMLAMLKQEGPAPKGRFEDLKYLQPVRDYKARHASTLLVLDALIDALNQINSKKSAA